MKKVLVLISFLNLFYFELMAQMPNTNIILFEYDFVNDSIIIKNKIALTSGNCYNNQPSFSDNCKKVFYTTNRNDSLHTDIFVFDIRKSRHICISNTPLSEYSPNQDYTNKNAVWHVRVESDKKQHLRRFESNKPINENMCMASDSVGYYALSDGSDMGLIVLNNGLEFHTFARGDSTTRMIKSNTGRFLQYDRTTNGFWFHGYSSTGDILYRYDRTVKSIVDSIPALSGCKDYGIDIQGNIFGGHHGELYRYIPSAGKKWEKMVDLNPLCGDFYRLSFCKCGKHFCVVTFEGQKP